MGIFGLEHQRTNLPADIPGELAPGEPAPLRHAHHGFRDRRGDFPDPAHRGIDAALVEIAGMHLGGQRLRCGEEHLIGDESARARHHAQAEDAIVEEANDAEIGLWRVTDNRARAG